MIIRPLILASSIVVSWSLIARETSDVIVMNNGDHLTCKIKKLEAGVLYVGLDYADGDVSIDWRKVARIRSNQLFLVQTREVSVLRGTLNTPAKANTEQPIQLEIADASQAEKPAAIEMSQIFVVRQTAEQSLQRWSGNIKRVNELLTTRRQRYGPNIISVFRRYYRARTVGSADKPEFELGRKQWGHDVDSQLVECKFVSPVTVAELFLRRPW